LLRTGLRNSTLTAAAGGQNRNQNTISYSNQLQLATFDFSRGVGGGGAGGAGVAGHKLRDCMQQHLGYSPKKKNVAPFCCNTPVTPQVSRRGKMLEKQKRIGVEEKGGGKVGKLACEKWLTSWWRTLAPFSWDLRSERSSCGAASCA